MSNNIFYFLIFILLFFIVFIVFLRKLIKLKKSDEEVLKASYLVASILLGCVSIFLLLGMLISLMIELFADINKFIKHISSDFNFFVKSINLSMTIWTILILFMVLLIIILVVKLKIKKHSKNKLISLVVSIIVVSGLCLSLAINYFIRISEMIIYNKSVPKEITIYLSFDNLEELDLIAFLDEVDKFSTDSLPVKFVGNRNIDEEYLTIYANGLKHDLNIMNFNILIPINGRYYLYEVKKSEINFDFEEKRIVCVFDETRHTSTAPYIGGWTYSEALYSLNYGYQFETLNIDDFRTYASITENLVSFEDIPLNQQNPMETIRFSYFFRNNFFLNYNLETLDQLIYVNLDGEIVDYHDYTDVLFAKLVGRYYHWGIVIVDGKVGEKF